MNCPRREGGRTTPSTVFTTVPNTRCNSLCVELALGSVTFHLVLCSLSQNKTPFLLLTTVGRALSSASRGVLPAVDVETYTPWDLNPCFTSPASISSTTKDTMPHWCSARPRSIKETPGSVPSRSRSELAKWRMRSSMGRMPMSIAYRRATPSPRRPATFDSQNSNLQTKSNAAVDGVGHGVCQ